jgi:hypothetical protein
MYQKKCTYEPKCGLAVVTANEYSCVHGAQINFGDVTPYLTYGFYISVQKPAVERDGGVE